LDLKKNLITLTTDFGNRDYFSGAMKGVILGINGEARFVDISHDVPSHDIWAGAYLFGSVYQYFPQYTVHMVIVDPGVGGPRRPIIAVTDKHYFIAPDNGVLSFVFNDPGFSRVIHMTAEHYQLKTKGSTFHARDIFSPAAAWLSKGVEVEKFGEEINDYLRFSIPVAKQEAPNVFSGEVVYSDKFGNCITNIAFEDVCSFMESTGLKSYIIKTKDIEIKALSPFYASEKRGETGAVVNGNGFIEIFINQGDARKTLGLKRGEKAQLIFG
jgi:S-adenosyl-L-methionine hydrolase (adenosine-forming)